LKYYQFKGLAETQEVFDEWRHLYNHQRPHEGIGMKRPIDRYKTSHVKFPEKLPEIVYEKSDEVRKVQKNGAIEFKGKALFIGEHLYGEMVGVRPTETDGVFNVFYAKNRINKVNLKK